MLYCNLIYLILYFVSLSLYKMHKSVQTLYWPLVRSSLLAAHPIVYLKIARDAQVASLASGMLGLLAPDTFQYVLDTGLGYLGQVRCLRFYLH